MLFWRFDSERKLWVWRVHVHNINLEAERSFHYHFYTITHWYTGTWETECKECVNYQLGSRYVFPIPFVLLSLQTDMWEPMSVRNGKKKKIGLEDENFFHCHSWSNQRWWWNPALKCIPSSSLTSAPAIRCVETHQGTPEIKATRTGSPPLSTSTCNRDDHLKTKTKQKRETSRLWRCTWIRGAHHDLKTVTSFS